MTGQEMVDEVRASIQRSTSGLSDARILRRLNWGQESLAGAHTFYEMRTTYAFNTVISQKAYALPSRVKEVFSIRLISGSESRKLSRLGERHFDEQVPYPEDDSTGKSLFYVDFSASALDFYPIPDAVYAISMRYSAMPADLTLTTVSTLQYKDSLLIATGVGHCFYLLREEEEAETWFNGNVKRLYLEALAADQQRDVTDYGGCARPFRISRSGINTDYKNPFAE